MSEEKQKLYLPSQEEFCLEAPLYQSFELDGTNESDLYNFISSAANIDCYCVDCQKESVFNGEQTDIGPSYNFNLSDRLIFKKYICSRRPSHEIYFLFQVKNKTVFKIGQFPSHADLSLPEIRKYRKVLKEEDFREFHRAFGLVTHGVGIGAFVYLRRIFEKLIENAHYHASQIKGWDEDAYSKLRMAEKIEMLKGHLPDFLVEQKALYGILSKGIHELSEQDCLEAFPVVKLGIELILDEEIEKKKREDKLKSATKELDLLRKKHK